MRYVSFAPPALLFCLIATSLPGQRAAAQTERAGELAVSEESMQLRYITPVDRTAGELGFGLFLNENRDLVVNSNYYVEASQIGFRGLTILVGPIAYAALLSEENNDIFSIALGAEARLQLMRQPELTAVGRAAYAPDILTFGSADNLWDIVGRLELPLTDRVTGFGGYRLFEIDLLTGKSELEESVHLGLRYRF